MKKFVKRPRSDESTGTRTGPRARAAQERKFNDPYAKAERPARAPRAGGFDRGEGDDARRPAGRPAVITLDADVARVFRDSETVNEALRMVMRLARFAGSRPAFNRERPAPAFADRRGPPRGARPQERRGPPRPRAPRFKEE
ncbi:MAG TPA: hypothetical protein VFN64_07410 [Burkholderiaceae bacterium]|nr:hypothetical protein [Burkholderiaceae bacterium]